MKNLIYTFRKNLNIKTILGFLLMTALFALGSFVVYKNEIYPRMVAAYTQDAISADDEKTKIPLVQGETVTQTFTFPKDQMIAVGVELYSTSYHSKGTFELSAYDNKTNELLGTAEFDASKLADMTKPEIPDQEYFNINMGRMLIGNKGREMRVEFHVKSLSSASKVFLYANQDKKYDAATITGASVDKPTSIVVRSYCYQYGYWLWFWQLGCVVVYLTLFLSYIGVVLLQAKLHKIFLIAGTGLAICYTFLIPPLSVPDELVHITTAYYYSNGLLGIKEPNANSIYIRQTDLEALSHLQTTPNLKEYDYFMWNVLRKPGATKLVSYNQTQQSKNWILYIPTILGITVARLLGTNGATLLYFGRAFAVFAYLAVMYFSIKRMPIVKGAFFIFALSPIVMQQCCSYSYDSLPISLSFLFIAELFALLYSEEKVKKKNYIILFLLVFFIASSKGGVYIPECLLVLLIPKDKFIEEKGKKKFMVVMMGAIILGFAINTIPYLLLVFGISKDVTATQNYSNSLNCYTVSDVLLHPIHTMYVLMNTILKYLDYYFEGMFAGPLGWLNIAISPAWAYAMAFLMYLGIIPVKNEPLYINKKQRIATLSAILVTVAMIVASMFVSWTSRGNTTVSGIQGRYFTPIFFFLLFVLRSKFIKIERNIDLVLAFLGIALNVVILNNILSSIQTVM